ncbi:MAG: hypothetical protein KDA16_15155, partial [Phycisphaerales bacterium]|nr:hypothetical protein [Phycisphaerales bacterium]
MARIRTFTAKVEGMRKSDDWVVYPIDADGCAVAQCSNRIARVNLMDGSGILSKRIPGGAYF